MDLNKYININNFEFDFTRKSITDLILKFDGSG